MIIAYHLGLHSTDEDRLVKSLLKNPEVLAREGVAVPGPSRYRGVIRAAVAKLDGASASRETQEMLKDGLLDMDAPERLVLSDEDFICRRPRALDGRMLYNRAGGSTSALRNLFPEHKVEFFLAVRNPATWVPDMAARAMNNNIRNFINDIDPDLTVWSDVVRDIREANPDSPITVWCNEDTPMIWPEVMHEVAGIDPNVQLMGGFDILSTIMAKEGVKRLRSYLGSHPPVSEIQRRRVLSAFLDKYALDDEIEEELDLPGWTPELIEHLTDVYDDDMIEIARIPGVTLLTA